jgi:8-oxo-dGTP diphosphatase
VPATVSARAARAGGDRQRIRRRQRLGAYGIVRDPGGRILLVRAAEHLSVAGRWFLPGGGVEHGETPGDALRREVEEETGLVIGPVSLLGVLSDTWTIPDGTVLHTVRLVYAVDGWGGTLRDEPSGSSDRAAWFSSAELGGVPLVRYVKEALARFTDLPMPTGRG